MLESAQPSGAKAAAASAAAAASGVTPTAVLAAELHLRGLSLQHRAAAGPRAQGVLSSVLRRAAHARSSQHTD